ncbi:MAG: hypothetical protein RL518_1543 [Pseudomonadota bacterium]|jgi:subtilisin family serine protease
MLFFQVSLPIVVLQLATLLGLIVGAIQDASAQSNATPEGTPKRVFRGQEIVVSFPSMSGGFSARASAKVTNLKAGNGTTLAKSLSEGKLGVFSSTHTLGANAAGPIEIDEADIKKMCAAIRAANPGVTLECEANAIVESAATPNDPQYASLYGMKNISAPAAWDITTGSTSAVVAIIDTGIDYNHPDLVDNIATNSREIPNNGVDDDANGFIDDYYGYDFTNNDSNPMDDHYHGTHCAGTVGAKGNNGKGVAGVNWTVKLLPVKVLNSYGSGTLASVAAGMNYAVKRGAKILSMSLGTSSYSSTLENAVINARNAGALVVAAAGNSSSNNDILPQYPASLPQDNVISVAASSFTDALASFSNYGATSVDLAAPGENILSTYLGGQYAYASGTSMATPHVAGMAALLLAVNPSLSYTAIKSILLSTVDPIPAMAGKLVSGGRGNLYKAVLQARSSQTPTPIATPSATPTLTPTTIATTTPTLTPTWAPTEVPTQTPTTPPTVTATPTQTPPPMDPPAETEPDPNTVSISTERTRTRVYVFGDIISYDDTPQSNLLVKMICGGRAVATRRTDTEGYYEFVFRRPARPIRCYAEDATGARSRRITVR